MMTISYILFDANSNSKSPLQRYDGRGVLRFDTWQEAVTVASAWVINQRYETLHVFEDDGLSVAPVLTIGRHASSM